MSAQQRCDREVSGVRATPAPAHWFETYVPRKQTVYALDALAATGRVQLELDPRLAEPLLPEALVDPAVICCKALYVLKKPEQANPGVLVLNAGGTLVD